MDSFCTGSNNNSNKLHQLWERTLQSQCEVICSVSWRWIRRDHLQGDGVWIVCMPASYWGCFVLFNGLLGDTWLRKQFESYENSASNDALREQFYNESLTAFCCSLLIFSPFLLQNEILRWHYKEKLLILVQGRIPDVLTQTASFLLDKLCGIVLSWVFFCCSVPEEHSYPFKAKQSIRALLTNAWTSSVPACTWQLSFSPHLNSFKNTSATKTFFFFFFWLKHS